MSELWAASALSVRIAAVATLVTVLFGVPLAWAMARRKFPGRGILEAIILMPVVLPPTVVGYALLMLFGANGWIGRYLGGYSIAFRLEGAVLAAVVVALPMLYLPAKAGFAAVERELEDVATLMGANRWQTFWHVSVPLARRGLLSGIVLAFARALGEFGATVMVFGWQPGRVTLPISVYAQFEQGDLNTALPTVLVMAIAALGLVLVYNALASQRD
ncbi:MAG: putative molybdenum transporter permease protein [Phycisphaerales bacterium]|nr:putative molybdenum transporter permease protein [Phycisphaerales bacterium]